MNNKVFIFICISLVCIASCAPRHRMGMIEDADTGLQYGSVVERNLIIDSAQLENKRLKISIRNISGDTNYDMSSLISYLENRYSSKGYKITHSDDYGVYIDVNMLYSGKIRSDMRNEFGFLGAAAGGIVGYRSQESAGTAIGILAGATLGSIIGSYVTDDTYIIVAEVNIGIARPQTGTTDSTIVFSSGKRDDYQERTGIRHFSQKLRTRVAVFAGGRNIVQSQITGGVRERIKNILADII
jgi:outer membrane lipoprotein SlyB